MTRGSKEVDDKPSALTSVKNCGMTDHFPFPTSFRCGVDKDPELGRR